MTGTYEPIHINLAEIPAFQRDVLADMALTLTEACFSLPGMEERFQAWLAARRAHLTSGVTP